MARARNIKPGFFTNDLLAEIDPLGRILFAGIWTIADRAGRLLDRPKKIKAEVLPFDNCDIEALLSDLAKHRFITRYEVDSVRYLQVENWDKHQNPHIKEAESTIPEPCKHSSSTIQTPCEAQPKPERAGLIPDSLNLIPDSLLPTPTGVEATPPAKPAASPRGTRLPKDWVLPKTWGDWALAERKDWTADNVRKVAEKFKDHWLAKAGRDANKVEWEATWRNWVRGEGSEQRGPASIAQTVVAAPIAICRCCGNPASRKVGSEWYCADHDQFSERKQA